MDLNSFKLKLKEWRDNNDDDYDEFEDMMNNVPLQGFNSIYVRANMLIKGFEKRSSKKYNNPNDFELSDIIEYAKQDGLAQKLVSSLDVKDSDNFIPAMLCWLYLGRSFECMVEQGEDIMKEPNTKWLQKIAISVMIKHLVKVSIKEKFRTKEDWNRYYELRKSIESKNILESAISEVTSKDKSKLAKGRKNSVAMSMIEYINDDYTESKKCLILKLIGSYLNNHKTDASRHVATMLTALEEHSHLKSYIKSSIYSTIRDEFGVEIGSDNLINAYLNPANCEKNIKADELDAAITYFSPPNE